VSLVPVSKKIPAGICGIFFGYLGVHKFVMGFPRAGLVMLGLYALGWATSCLGFGQLIVWALHIVGLVEGIIYLAKNDTDFYRDYVIYKKEWF
jgi:TM2 domain-containing membrane protein YozV